MRFFRWVAAIDNLQQRLEQLRSTNVEMARAITELRRELAAERQQHFATTLLADARQRQVTAMQATIDQHDAVVRDLSDELAHWKAKGL